MRAAQPATIHSRLVEQLGVVLLARSEFLSHDEFQIARLEDEIRKLSGPEPVLAQLCEGMVGLLLGDFDRVRHFTGAARTLGAGLAADDVEWTGAINLGYVSRAHELYERLSHDIQCASGSLQSGTISASFRALLSGTELLQRAKISGMERFDTAVKTAADGAAALEGLGLSEDDVRAMLAVAGEVLRENRLYWLRDAPLVRAMAAGDDSFLLYQHVVRVDRRRALELTRQVSRRLEERNLEKHGLAFAFLAEQTEE